MKVLIADDDATYRRLLHAILQTKKHQVIEAADGQTAWEMIQADPPPFVITDWMMPNMDGPELIHHIRAAQFENYTYIILLTARDAQEDVVSGLESGADDYLTKPFDLNELRARIGIGERILDLETRLRQALKTMEQMATHDSLTGLFNRRALYQHADNEMERCGREIQPVSIMMIDLDYFKQVNDRYGHILGDQVLCLAAKTIQYNLRTYDWVGRWGGEEFLAVLPSTDLREAAQVAERLRLEIEAASLQLAAGEPLKTRASLGVVSTIPGRGLNFEQLVQKADEALYAAKNGGRNRVHVYTGEKLLSLWEFLGLEAK
jgi:two-component system chemotaxis response regulator CheY